MRISKYLSQNNICSRREAEFFISQGWLRVDGQIVREPGTKISETSEIVLDEKIAEYQNRLLTIVLNKPVGYVSGQPEKHYLPAARLVVKDRRFQDTKHPYNRKIEWPINGLAPAGRLDIDSTGLLILTQDGRIARKLIAPDSDIEKEYLVRVNQSVTDSQIGKLTWGLKIDGVVLREAKVELLDRNYFRLVLTQGRKRQIRRMCALVNLEVSGLKRVRIGNVRLGALPPGMWRPLGAGEKF